MRRGFIIAALLVTAPLASACERAQPGRPLLVHLEPGDSVEIVGWSTAAVPGEPQGLLLAYRPFTSMRDTAKLRQIALAVWHSYARPVAEQRRTSWIVLQAHSRPRGSQTVSVETTSTYGVVLDRGTDGKWYFHKTQLPVDQP